MSMNDSASAAAAAAVAAAAADIEDLFFVPSAANPSTITSISAVETPINASSRADKIHATGTLDSSSTTTTIFAKNNNDFSNGTGSAAAPVLSNNPIMKSRNKDQYCDNSGSKNNNNNIYDKNTNTNDSTLVASTNQNNNSNGGPEIRRYSDADIHHTNATTASVPLHRPPEQPLNSSKRDSNHKLLTTSSAARSNACTSLITPEPLTTKYDNIDISASIIVSSALPISSDNKLDGNINNSTTSACIQPLATLISPLPPASSNNSQHTKSSTSNNISPSNNSPRPSINTHPANATRVISNPYNRKKNNNKKVSKNMQNSAGTSNKTRNNNTTNTITKTNSSTIISTKRTRTGIAIGIKGKVIRPASGMGTNISRGATLSQGTKKIRAATRILTPGEREQIYDTLPKGMNVYEMFFAALLRSSAKEFHDSATAIASSSSKKSGGSSTSTLKKKKDFMPQEQKQLWETICNRLNISIPTKPIEPIYDDIHDHLEMRVSLIMEEARHSISEPLYQVLKNSATTGYTKRSSSGSKLYCVVSQNFQHNKHTGHATINFCKSNSSFTKEELYNIRPGITFVCHKRDVEQNINTVLLGCVLQQKQLSTSTFNIPIMFFRDFVSIKDNEEWVIQPITSLISEFRQFEAAYTIATTSIEKYTSMIPPILYTLLGKKNNENFPIYSTNGNNNDFDFLTDDSFNDTYTDKSNAPLHSNNDNTVADTNDTESSSSCMFQLPTLNHTQKKASDDFFNSDPNSIILIQGPPGTGKTTLLVSTICRYVLKSHGLKRLMVCAPTNKAIIVLAKRYLSSINLDYTTNTNNAYEYPNVILVGDADKLLENDDFDHNNKNNNSYVTSLRSMFVYSWLPTLLQEYNTLLKNIDNNNNICQQKYNLKQARILENRLTTGLPGLPTETRELAKQIVTLYLKRNDPKEQKQASSTLLTCSELQGTIKRIIRSLEHMNSDTVWRELLSSASVIFCTLTSAGSSIVKSSLKIDDIIVDEAAASTESELYIPILHLHPKRLLAVGDPMQLPATVLSKHANRYGLNKSLHERLMIDCNWDHVMLNIQYRMKPDISAFPSSQFYDGKLLNGNNVESPSYKNEAPFLQGRPYSFIQVDGREEQGAGGSYRNVAEANVIMEILHQLQQQHYSFCRQQRQHNLNHQHWCHVDRIRIITFYKGQVTLLENLTRQRNWKNVVVATVDSSQGCEADIVIVSFVRSLSIEQQQKKQQARAGFLTDNRRINVALTRAKHQLICVGNANSMSQMTGADTIQALAKDAQNRNNVLSLQQIRPPPGPPQQKQQLPQNQRQRRQHNHQNNQFQKQRQHSGSSSGRSVGSLGSGGGGKGKKGKRKGGNSNRKNDMVTNSNNNDDDKRQHQDGSAPGQPPNKKLRTGTVENNEKCHHKSNNDDGRGQIISR